MASILRIAVAAAVLAGVMAVLPPAGAQADARQDARQLVPWLDVPAAWPRTVDRGVVAVSPADLPPGTSLVLLVEPPRKPSGTLAAAYEQALRDLGPWRPVGEPAEQRFDNGWTFRLGVGVATLGGTTYTAQTAVGRRGDVQVRFWALADSDRTFNRYKTVVGTAIASAQDITHPPARAAAADATTPGPQGPMVDTPRRGDGGSALPPGFGQGISGVYVGLERGLAAGAGAGPGLAQSANTTTGRIETTATGTAPQVQTRIADFMEVDVFYPDGTYRRRLPVRGLMSDASWERRRQPILWGTWERRGGQVIVRRGSYTATYTIDGEQLVSSRDRPWIKLPLHTGLRLDGVFAREDLRRADAPRLALRADGSYEERGDFLRMVGSPWHLIEPDADAMVGRWSDAQLGRAMSASSGRYDFDNFTLTLRAADGRVWQINAYVPPGEPVPQPRRLVINGRALARD